MTDAQELAELEAIYLGWIRAGCPQSYTTGDGRSVTKISADIMMKRIDVLRASVAADSSNSSGFSVADFRRDY